MHTRGFTLLDLLVSLCALSFLMFAGIPALSSQIKLTEFAAGTQTLYDAIEFTRAQAVFKHQRITIKNNDRWEDGWEIFVDNNDNGSRDNNEALLAKQTPLKRIQLTPNTPVRSYISFVGTGESQLSSGAFQAGTIKSCPKMGGKGYALVLSRSGRLRKNPLSERECNP